MTAPPTGGDDDPVAQFSDPELKHGYAELPPPAGVYYPGGRFPQQEKRSGCLGAWPPRRLLLILIIVIILGVAAGLVVGLAA
jgi:hypothetical protein